MIPTEMIFLFGIGSSVLIGGILGFVQADLLSNTLQTLATVAAVTVGYMGLSTWKKQLKGKTEYQLARRCLIGIYKLRDAINEVRHPLISLGEMQAAIKENGEETDVWKDRTKTNRAVYQKRWESILTARRNLYADALEAEVEWGRDAKIAILKLDEQVTELFVTLDMFLNYPEDVIPEDRSKHREIIYAAGKENTFNKLIEQSVITAESRLKNYLTQK